MRRPVYWLRYAATIVFVFGYAWVVERCIFLGQDCHEFVEAYYLFSFQETNGMQALGKAKRDGNSLEGMASDFSQHYFSGRPSPANTRCPRVKWHPQYFVHTL